MADKGCACHEESPFIFKVSDFRELIGKLQENVSVNVFRGLRQFGGLRGLDREFG
jgi:hypothetical protein